MCKIAVIPHIPKKTKPSDVWAFAKAMRYPLTRHDSHGFGFATIDRDNNLSTAKWEFPKNAFAIPSEPLPGAGPYEDLLETLVPDGLDTGPWVVGKAIRSMLLHGRWATTAQGLLNAHPHLDDYDAPNVALVHNGVLQNYEEYLVNTSCDSESLVHLYHAYDVLRRPTQMTDLTESLSGYWAWGALVLDGRGRWVCDIVRDNLADLYCCYVPRLNTLVWCTSDKPVREACSRLKWPAPRCTEVKDYTFSRTDVTTGKVVYTGKVKGGVGLMASTSSYRVITEEQRQIRQSLGLEGPALAYSRDLGDDDDDMGDPTAV